MDEISDNLTQESFIVRLESYNGPLDVLLDLAKEQKLDLRDISIADLVDQYIHFVETAKNMHIQLSAEYLVMASWLVWLKSEILLPEELQEEEVSEALLSAEHLAFHLRRLNTIKELCSGLKEQNILGYARFSAGYQYQKQWQEIIPQTSFEDLQRAYAQWQHYQQNKDLTIEMSQIWSPHDGIKFFQNLLIKLTGNKDQNWHELIENLPKDYFDQQVPPKQKAAILASSFTAALFFAQQGRLDIFQEEAFGAIYFRLKKQED